MADFFDRFIGADAPLTSHTADSGGNWTGATNVHTDGTGAIYLASTFVEGAVPVHPWTPPGTDYRADFTVGAGWLLGTNGAYMGPLLRVNGSTGSQNYYGIEISGPPVTPNHQAILFGNVSGAAYQVGTTYTFGLVLGLTDVIGFGVAGTGAAVTLTIYLNGALVFTTTDSASTRITTTGSLGLRISGTGATDIIRTLWAGALAGPTVAIAPTAPTVAFGATQGFTLSPAYSGETFTWASLHGTTPGTAATTTYTAPGSGTSDTVTGRSVDMPSRLASATVTLGSGAASAFTLTGPSGGFKNNVSTNFTFTPSGGNFTGTITPAMTGLAGTWAPATLTWSATSTAQTAKFTPSATGAGNANGTASPPLTPPASVGYTSNPQTLAVTPGALPTSSTTTETFYGSGTLWLTSAPTFSPGGSVAGVVCGTPVVISNTEAHADVTTGTATGTFTWTDSTTGATATEVVANIVNVLSIGEGFATGLSTVGYAVYNAAGAPISAWTTSGVTERGTASGDYGAVVPLPQDGANYEIRWSQTSGTTPPFVHDIRTAALTAVNLNLTQTGLVPRSLNSVADTALTVGDALVAAICAAAGKESVAGTTYTIKSPSTGSVIRTFILDSATAPSSRN